MALTGGELLVAQLQREGVRHIFGIPGVQLDWAVEALRRARGAIEYMRPPIKMHSWAKFVPLRVALTLRRLPKAI